MLLNCGWGLAVVILYFIFFLRFIYSDDDASSSLFSLDSHPPTPTLTPTT